MPQNNQSIIHLNTCLDVRNNAAKPVNERKGRATDERAETKRNAERKREKEMEREKRKKRDDEESRHVFQRYML